jgi:hypothetical protein
MGKPRDKIGNKFAIKLKGTLHHAIDSFLKLYIKDRLALCIDCDKFAIHARGNLDHQLSKNTVKAHENVVLIVSL